MNQVTYDEAKASIIAARIRIRSQTAVWRGLPTPPEQMKKEVQAALAPALDYLASHNITLNPDQLAACTADELLEWVEQYIGKLGTYEELEAELSRKS